MPSFNWHMPTFLVTHSIIPIIISGLLAFIAIYTFLSIYASLNMTNSISFVTHLGIASLSHLPLYPDGREFPKKGNLMRLILNELNYNPDIHFQY